MGLKNAIVGHDALASLPLTIIVPITSWDDKYAQADWHVKLGASPENGLKQPFSADTFQVRSISRMRLVKQLGNLGEADMAAIGEGLKISLALE